MSDIQRILILEDDHALGLQWQRALEGAGMAVVLAETADDAIEALHESTFAAVVLDMFVVDAQGRIEPRGGVTVMGEMRLRIERPPPIILISAASREAQVDRMGILMEAYATLSKPVGTQALLATISAAIDAAGRG